MSKHILSIKKIKKQIVSVNNLIESYFNRLKYFKSNYKKILLNKDNRVFLGFGIVAFLTLIYFLVPTFYNKNLIQLEIKNQIFKNYNIDIQFNEKMNYGLLPKPHFSTKRLSILRDGKEIGTTDTLKVFIGIGEFLSINKLSMKNLIFYKTDFNIYLNDIIFFKNLLKIEPNENKIIFKKSNIFFRNKYDEVLFINKINNSQFYYDSNNLMNVLSSSNEIFNVPYKLIIKNDKFNKNISTKFNSKKIRLNVETETNYDDETKNGLLDILFVSKSTSMKYKIKKNFLSYLSEDNTYKGNIDFKPFYMLADFNYDGLSFKDLLKDDSILLDLIKSEILNNKNLNVDLIFNVKDIINIDELNNMSLKIAIEEGNIIPSNSQIMWKDDLEINLTDSLLILDMGNINLIGNIVIYVKDVNDFYKSFQVKKVYRKKIQKIEFDFNYDLNKKKITFDNFKIDDNSNINVKEFINKVNSDEKIIFNKITFKNFVSNFFEAYAG
jgi:hypothetical protein